MDMKAVDRLVPWIVGAVAITVALAATYGAVQQGNRSSADDAPRALLSQLASSAGTDTPGAVPSPRVDVAQSLMPFYLIFNGSDGRTIAGDGYLDGKRARIPDGVLQHTVDTGSDHLTWEPQPGLRFALSTSRHGQTVIAAAQSLAPFEERTDRIGVLLLLGWLIALGGLACGALLHLVAGRRLDRSAVSR